jgi:hypothetical protein
VLNRLLSTLTQALQSSGVDLSQASISVQIELGKRSNSRVTGSPSIVKVILVPKLWYPNSLFSSKIFI